MTSVRIIPAQDGEGSPDEPIKPEALRAIASLERRAEHPYSAQLIDMAATEIERLRSANKKLTDVVTHYEGWFGTECPCDDEECALDGWWKP